MKNNPLAVVPPPIAAPVTGWEQALFKVGNQIIANIHNICLILENSPDWLGMFVRDDFAKKIWVTREPPRSGKTDNGEQRPFCDGDISCVAAWLTEFYGIAHAASTDILQAVELVAQAHSVNPPLEYLSSLVWDKQPRLATWLTQYLGVVDIPNYTSQVGSKWMIAAVARVFKPGCKVDTMLILEGDQGLGKSRAVATLGGPWAVDELAALGTKDSAEQLQGAWIIEMSELDSMQRSEVSRVKAFLSRRVDRFRPSYGRGVMEYPRSCIFAGTCNSDSYLKDDTGGRRFWPVTCTSIDIAGLQTARDQLWAEAVYLYTSGTLWYIDDEIIKKAAESEQEERTAIDAWQETIEEHLVGLEKVRVNEILEWLGIAVEKWSQQHKNRVAKCLKSAGWHKKVTKVNSKNTIVYYPGV